MTAASALAGVFLLCLPFAGYWSVRFAAADQALALNTEESARRAAALAPDLAVPWLYLARFDPDLSPTALPAALARNPYYTSAAEQYAIWQEMNGKPGDAEATLLKAAQRDHTHETTWALTNFYFRQDRDELFWRYARQAVQYRVDSPAAVYGLAWQHRPDALWLLDHFVPQEAWALHTYLEFLVRQDLAGPALLAVGRRVLAVPPVHVEHVVQAVDWLWNHDRPADAAALWQDLEDRHLAPVEKPAPPELLTNPRFAAAYGLGFDWRFTPASGVVLNPMSRGLRLEATAEIPSHYDLLWQPVLLEPGRRYRLRWEWRGEMDLTSAAALHWSLHPVKESPSNPRTYGPAFAPADDGQSWSFAAPPSPAVQLVLEYRRDPGVRAWQGTLSIGSVSLQREGQ